MRRALHLHHARTYLRFLVFPYEISAVTFVCLLVHTTDCTTINLFNRLESYVTQHNVMLRQVIVKWAVNKQRQVKVCATDY